MNLQYLIQNRSNIREQSRVLLMIQWEIISEFLNIFRVPVKIF